VVLLILAFAGQFLAAEFPIGLAEIAILDADATGVTHGSVENVILTKAAVRGLWEDIGHIPAMSLADVTGWDLIMTLT
jgi:hypothetical protein